MESSPYPPQPPFALLKGYRNGSIILSMHFEAAAATEYELTICIVLYSYSPIREKKADFGFIKKNPPA
jgi:hypothetical protein